ncbi:MAG: hypothetical protein RIQ60_3501 [Pseudomonadota bacterium]|jgi:hypothetical protein
MNRHQLVVSFARDSSAQLQMRLNSIVNAMTDNPRFPGPWPAQVPSLALLREKDEVFIALQQAVDRRDFGQLRKRDEAREELEHAMLKVATYVEQVADGDMDVLETCGFELRRDASRPPSGAGMGVGGGAGATTARLLPPQDVRVGHGPRAGTLVLNAASQRGVVAYEVQISLGDPTAEEGWRNATIVQSVRHLVLDGLAPGVTWVRLRAVRAGGLTGPWTAPLSALVG